MLPPPSLQAEDSLFLLNTSTGLPVHLCMSLVDTQCHHYSRLSALSKALGTCGCCLREQQRCSAT